MAKQIVSPFQSFIEDFIKTAESMGHKGWAKLSSSHPAIKKGQWSQIRGNYSILASYADELGNQVELIKTAGPAPVIRMHDDRQTFYCRLQGTSTGYAIKATGRDAARRILAAREVVAVDSAYLIVANKPALGVSYSHI